MKRAGFLLWWLPGSFVAAIVAWGLMWLTDRLYDWNTFISWIAIPLRIVTFLMQLGVLMGCLVTIIGTGWLSFDVFYRASKGINEDDETNKPSALNIRGYAALLVIPAVMAVTSLVVGLFHNWLNFNEHGLGLISLGYRVSAQVLELGSVVVLLAWLIVLPVFLHNRKAISITVSGDIDNSTAQKRSILLGFLSVGFGVIGIFWSMAVMGIIAIILAAVQLKNRKSRLAMAGFVLGVIDILQAIFWYVRGSIPSLL